MTTTTTYSPDNSVIKQGETVRKTIKAGESFPVLTPLMADTTEPDTLVKWDGVAGKEIALSACVADAPASNEIKAVIVSGTYRISYINWPNGLTDAQKRAAFLGTALNVDDE
ncbi:head decoration protein [Vibrio sp. S4M6]|uniref:head decoration protein n=1 Tax=Vibrio sinus TaxID=2946865 RepID=UPI002029C385|nr:head decoration protein [Vibrio sinus]MCL9783656.1 head decoration protein [Vibrio sinus]